MHVVVLEQFPYKLDYFLFCQIFEKLFNICAKILIKSKVQLSSLNHRHSSTLAWNWDNFYTLNYFMTLKKTFLLFYITIILELKKQMLKLRFKI